ncbi:MAG: hydrogenase maturation protease [Acidobacteriota bacterium]
MKPILILGLGNPLQGDDGVGCRVIEALQQETLPDGVEAMDGGTPGVGLVHLLEGRRCVFLVDAAEMGQAPGTVVRLRPEELSLTSPQQQFSLHRAGVAEALALAHAVKMSLPEVVVFGVQPSRVGWGMGLSPQVEAAVGPVVEALLNEARVSHT